MLRRLMILSGLLLASGCLYHVRDQADEAVCKMVMQPYDLLPPQPEEKKVDSPKAMPASTSKTDSNFGTGLDVQTTSYMQAKPKYDLKIPSEIPGSETRLIELPKNEEEKQRYLRQLYPKLTALPDEPTPLPGPDGRPYTLADFQRIAAGNSPQLRQAASDVEAAKGALRQARAYPNPNMGYQVTTSNDGSTAGVQGPFIDQTIKTAGKIKLQAAAAEMDLRNAELALKRARTDLSTQVRNAYYALVVAKETVRVNKALARFTDEIYRIHSEGILGAGIVAAYEPAALRAQAYTARLAYKQSIQTYQYAWIQLASTIGLRQLPLTEVEGRVDRFIPYFDYNQVLAHALVHHTDVLTAANGIEKSKYNLRFARVTPIPDVDFNVAVLHEFALAPKQTVPTATITLPIPLWDHNEGNIRSAEAALTRASEEPHRVETNITNNLASAYMGYKNNLEALEYYRRYILPDQVRAYRGVFLRRDVDLTAQFNDLVTAQQTLAADVTNYLGILGQLWISVVTVADFLQTDDLFQLAKPHELPPLPDLDQLPAWPCCHDCPQVANGTNAECFPCTTKPRQEGRHADER